MDDISKSDIDKHFGKIVRAFRVKNHLTQEQFSEKIGISPKYISRMENGSDGISTLTLIKCMNILGITPNTIFKPFISNDEVTKNIELSEKINCLSLEKKNFANSILDLLQNQTET